MSNGTVVEKRIEVFASAARTATATSGTYSIPGDADHVCIAIETTAFTSGTFTAKIQQSLTGNEWVDVAGATTTAIAATGVEVKAATSPVLPMLRVVLTGASTPVATQSVSIVYG
jgi:hypothetical protein